MTTKTATKAAKAAKAKPASKPAAKEATKPAVKLGAYAALLAKCLKGDFGTSVQRFYASASVYHAKQKTVFPRVRNAGKKLMTVKDATAWLEAHKVSGIPAGDGVGQRLYDEMMSQVKAA